jgi:hypothetical protein
MLNQKLKDMDELSKTHYYEGQLEIIDFHSEYKPTIKIKGMTTETKWMDLGEDLARVLVKKLIEEFHLDAE